MGAGDEVSTNQDKIQAIPPGLGDEGDTRIPAVVMYRIHALSKLISHFFDSQVGAHGITRAQWTTLMYVHHMPGATQTALADSMQMGRAAMGKMLDRMESKGLINRRADENDQRVRRVYPTGVKDEFATFMPDAERALYDTFMGNLSAEQLQALDEALAIMHQNGLSAVGLDENE
jgi:MarR family transcriptional regulator for hemolysin